MSQTIYDKLKVPFKNYLISSMNIFEILASQAFMFRGWETLSRHRSQDRVARSNKI